MVARLFHAPMHDSENEAMGVSSTFVVRSWGRLGGYFGPSYYEATDTTLFGTLSDWIFGSYHSCCSRSEEEVADQAQGRGKEH